MFAEFTTDDVCYCENCNKEYEVSTLVDEYFDGEWCSYTKSFVCDNRYDLIEVCCVCGEKFTFKFEIGSAVFTWHEEVSGIWFSSGLKAL